MGHAVIGAEMQIVYSHDSLSQPCEYCRLSTGSRYKPIPERHAEEKQFRLIPACGPEHAQSAWADQKAAEKRDAEARRRL